eukprot:2161368-Rhodomonas_salina.1
MVPRDQYERLTVHMFPEIRKGEKAGKPLQLVLPPPPPPVQPTDPLLPEQNPETSHYHRLHAAFAARIVVRATSLAASLFRFSNFARDPVRGGSCGHRA